MLRNKILCLISLSVITLGASAHDWVVTVVNHSGNSLQISTSQGNIAVPSLTFYNVPKDSEQVLRLTHHDADYDYDIGFYGQVDACGSIQSLGEADTSGKWYEPTGKPHDRSIVVSSSQYAKVTVSGNTVTVGPVKFIPC